MKRRYNMFIAPELDEKLDLWTKKLDIPKSILITLSVRAGIDAIIRAVSPGDAFTPEQWASIVEAARDKGLYEIEDAENKPEHSAS